MQDHTTLGYTYPELQDATTESLIATINQMYGANAVAGGIMKRSQPHPNGYIGYPGEEVNGSYRYYTANVVSQKHAVNGSYAIYIFLGEPDSDPTKWPTDPNLVGTHSIFASLSSQAEPLPGADTSTTPTLAGRPDSLKVSGTVPLTQGLLSKAQSGELKSMNDDDVEAYLQDHLHWGVAVVS